jgi:hypothetical protein
MNIPDKKYFIAKAQTVDIQRSLHTLHTLAYAVGEEEMTVSDGYHTMDELYDHRITLYIALCRLINNQPTTSSEYRIWRSRRHSDGELCFGTGTQYVLGIGTEKGKQITYHIPVARWDETDFAEEIPMAPNFDGHTSEDVLNRLKGL